MDTDIGFYGDMDLDTDTAAGAGRGEDTEVRSLRKKGMLLPSPSPCPGCGCSVESQLGHIKMADNKVGGAWVPRQPPGVGSLSRSWTVYSRVILGESKLHSDLALTNTSRSHVPQQTTSSLRIGTKPPSFPPELPEHSLASFS